MLKTQGYEHDDDILDQQRYQQEVTPPRKLDENYFELKYQKELQERKKRDKLRQY